MHLHSLERVQVVYVLGSETHQQTFGKPQEVRENDSQITIFVTDDETVTFQKRHVLKVVRTYK